MGGWGVGDGGTGSGGDRGGCLNHMKPEAQCKYVLCGSNEEATGSESLLVVTKAIPHSSRK